MAKNKLEVISNFWPKPLANPFGKIHILPVCLKYFFLYPEYQEISFSDILCSN